MSKKRVSIFFSILFLLFITAPTVVTLVDNSIDITFIYSTSEEEQENHSTDKNVKLFVAQFKTTDIEFTAFKEAKHLMHCSKTYAKPYLNLVFPPPENS